MRVTMKKEFLFVLCCLDMAFSELVWIGSNPALSGLSLDVPAANTAFILMDYNLVNGSVREFEVTTSNDRHTIRLMVWRPFGTTQLTYQLVSSSLYNPDGARLHKFYPGEYIEAREGDKLGFASETDNTVVTYDFTPLVEGSLTHTRSFSGTANLPLVGETVTFDDFDYNTWMFSVACVVDTEYGRGPLSTSTSTSTTTISTTTTTTTTTTPSPTSPTTTTTKPASSIKEIGNPTVDGKTLSEADGSFLIEGLPLEEGYMKSFQFYAAAANRSVRLEIWRPQGEKDFYQLIYSQYVTPEKAGVVEVKIDPPVRVNSDDRIGFTNPKAESGIVHTWAPSQDGSSIKYSKLENGTMPKDGDIVEFDLGMQVYKFSIKTSIDTDLDKYTTQRPTPGAAASSSKTSTRLDFLLAVAIVCVFLIIALIGTVYALCRVRHDQDKKEDQQKLKQSDVYGVAHDHSFYIKAYDNRNTYLEITPDPIHCNIPRDNVMLGDVISESAFTLVTKAEIVDLPNVETVTTVAAVKSLKATATDTQKHALMKELEAMKSVGRNKNVIELLGCCVEQDPNLIVMEFAAYGDLQGYLREIKQNNNIDVAGHNNYSLTKDMMDFCVQIARGMEYLASLKILHKDLATRHVLLSESKVCKITHFGFARDVIEHHQSMKAGQCPLPIRWMSPESLYSNIYTNKSDVWAFGVLLWEIVTLGATPYQKYSATEVRKLIKKGNALDKPQHCKEELWSVMNLCWKMKPFERPSFGDLEKRLQTLYNQSSDLIQMEKYHNEQFKILDTGAGTEVV